ncbi:hypothetical protein LA76x_4820 [Lysobacter antibioticus]|uniref:Uncharacterized protein n=1 Tax=Lysobacter antibioticus TaxID=84531 RepID=A0A0S2FH96_LYSAN|nr:hypothetical protein LA76x_4820 [Lysobacter antibioticus]
MQGNARNPGLGRGSSLAGQVGEAACVSGRGARTRDALRKPERMQGRAACCELYRHDRSRPRLWSQAARRGVRVENAYALVNTRCA